MNNSRILYPMVVTGKLKETKHFYEKMLGFEIRLEQEGYLQVRAGNAEGDPEIAFMAPCTMPDGTEFKEFSGKGLVLSVPTKSADEKAASLRRAGLEGVPDPTDKPWGWRSFLATDPSGVVLDFFHVIQGKPGLLPA